jgi:type I restriction enzyme S subunit
MSELKAVSSRKSGRLSDLVDLVRDKCAPTSRDIDIPCINLEDIPEGAGRAVSWSRASENLSIKTKFRAGDVLFGKLRPYLRKYAQPSFDGLCTSELLAFRAKPGVDPRYAYQVVGSQDFIDHCVAASFGTKMPRTDWGTASSFPTQIPEEAEQRRIADLLSAVDEQISLLEAEAAKESLRALALLQAVLPAGFAVEHTPKSRLADALLRIEAGKSFMCSDMPAPEGAWGVLKVSAVRPEGFVSSENKLVEDLALVNPRYEVVQGDLLMTRANTPELVGAASYVVAPQRRLLLCDKTLRLRPKPEVLPQYLWLWLQTPVARRHVEAHATGTSAGMKNISQAAIRNLPLALPSPDEQAALVRPIVALYEHIHCLLTSSSKLRRLKSGLSARLLIPGCGQKNE